MARLLHDAGYSLQANHKTREGKNQPDRNAQFEYINEQVSRVQKRGQPVVSMDTKKKENVGDFRSPGQESRPEDDPRKVDTNGYETGIKVSDKEMATLRISPCEFHGGWNYTIAPQRRRT